MHVTIERETTKEGLPFFKEDVHRLYVTVEFSEEEKFAIQQAGIKNHIYYSAPKFSPNQSEEIGAAYVSDLLKKKRRCLCTVRNLVDLNTEEGKIRDGLKNLKATIENTKDVKARDTYEL